MHYPRLAKTEASNFAPSAGVGCEHLKLFNLVTQSRCACATCEGAGWWSAVTELQRFVVEFLEHWGCHTTHAEQEAQSGLLKSERLLWTGLSTHRSSICLDVGSHFFARLMETHDCWSMSSSAEQYVPKYNHLIGVVISVSCGLAIADRRP
jgi:hypothetical protein